MTSHLKYAHAYARLGMNIFPVAPRSKQPLIKDMLRKATTDLGQLSAWWERWPDAEVGWVPGTSEGVVDLDVGHRASDVPMEELLAELRATDRSLPSTATIQSPSGGRGLLYRLPRDLAWPSVSGKVHAQVDLKGGGKGFVILPPSRHAKGGRYEWKDGCRPDFVADAPEWLEQWIRDYRGEQLDAPKIELDTGVDLADLLSAPPESGARHQTLQEITFRLAKNSALGLPSILEIARRSSAYQDMLRTDPPRQAEDELLRLARGALDKATQGKFGHTFRHQVEEEKRLEDVGPEDLIRFAQCELPPMTPLLSPILHKGELAMLWGYRGLGKTFIGLSMGMAVASGGKFGRWEAPSPCRVLFVDGEMPALRMQERALQLLDHWQPEPGQFRLLRHGQIGRSFRLTDEVDQQFIEGHLDGVDLLILDNLSALGLSGSEENESHSWLAAEEWLQHLRRSGITVLFLHHAGKGGGQRGTSRREDMLDLSIGLARPEGKDEDDAFAGLHTKVFLSKNRSVFGDEAKPFELRLVTEDTYANGVLRKVSDWQVLECGQLEVERVAEMYRDGRSYSEIAEALGVSRATVKRRLARAGQIGVMTEEERKELGHANKVRGGQNE